MRKITLICFLLLAGIITKAQYANTSWKGTYYIPDSTQMVLQFKQDTLLLNYTDGSNAETMHYEMHGDTLTMMKISGISPCEDIKGIYKLSVNDNKLTFQLIDDPCDPRAAAMPAHYLTKME